MPPGKIWSSAVWTCVCVPTTSVARPSTARPKAIFSEVASAWKSMRMQARLLLQFRDFGLDQEERIVDLRAHEGAAQHD